MLKHCPILLLLCASLGNAKAQQVDSIYFHLYTDSLKLGAYNYINVDGLLHDGRWLPLTSKEVRFSANAGRFEGNSLILDSSFKGEKVKVSAAYIRNPALHREIEIFIKRGKDTTLLKTPEEIRREIKQGRRSRRSRDG